MRILFCTFSLLFYLSLQVSAQSWSRIHYGYQGSPQMLASCTDPMGNYYVAGSVGDSFGRQAILKWDGVLWSFSSVIPLTTPYPLGQIYSMCSDATGNIYVGGSFRNSGAGCFVAKWNGTSWSELGSGAAALNANSTILSVCVDASGNIYAAGSFTNTAGEPYVAKWDGTSWAELGTGSAALHCNGTINSICSDNTGNIYAGGEFSDSTVYTAGNIYVAKWDGTNWSELGNGVSHWAGVMEIYTVLADNSGHVYCGGRLDSNMSVAVWDGASWARLGDPAPLNANNDVFSLCLDPVGNLYAAGAFTDSNKFAKSNCYVAKWNGSAWSELGSSSQRLFPDSWIFTLSSDMDGNIYAAGEFIDADSMGFIGRYGKSPLAIAPLAGKDPGVSIYPNPVSASFNIDLQNEKQYIDKPYYLLDCSGRVCHTGKLQLTNSIDISDLASGTYILSLGDTHTKDLKILKR